MPEHDRPELHVNGFTTRPDSVYGVSHVALAPERPLLDEVDSELCGPRVSSAEGQPIRHAIARIDQGTPGHVTGDMTGHTAS
jgi:hypothetical protein